MPHIEMDRVDLMYPLRVNRRATFKDFLLQRVLRRNATRPTCIKALDGITFRADGGECIGLIGRNGAGKSTLLRAIGGIYPAATGSREVVGSICTLFDIAAGFEWNATGWDNIRLRAYLQGETPTSLAGKLEAIAEFTQLGENLDLPLKYYSTGKIMLLSFAIAVCCEPEILLVDEFLSAGDLQFREKAIGRMIEMVRRSRIVMLASHDLAFLRQFCTRILCLEKGRIVDDGPAECIIERYTASMRQSPVVQAATAQI
ncbi:MAG TPA: ABC transporter ATP-binding protein [Gemmataceae bacterium]|nr:ABC transporter ATP-binding protein [Gemmataceae bacterium]